MLPVATSARRLAIPPQCSLASRSLSFGMIKKFTRAATRRIVDSDSLWRALGSLQRIDYLRVQRKVVEDERFKTKCARYFGTDTVARGPFAGLKYPGNLHHWNDPFAKLLGTYEAELHDALRHFAGQHYRSIVNIGFAEGFYLVGLARQHPHAELWGFDIDQAAHRICADLARLNNIAPARLHLAEAATADHLRPALAHAALVVCDCEGFEATLFTRETAALWCHADLLIECHDFIIPDVTASLVALLEATHEVQVVSSASTESKLDDVAPSARAVFSREELLQLVHEGRPCPMTWIVAQAKSRVPVERPGHSAP